MTTFDYRSLSASALLLLAAATFAPVFAQDSVHLAWMNGVVSVRRGDDGPWIPGAVDAPLKNGDHIATGPKAQTGIQFDEANVIHMGSKTEIRLDVLEPGHYGMEVIKGSITGHVAGLTAANVEVATPSVVVRTSKPGVFLIAINRAGESEIAARAGDVEVVAPRGSEWVIAGQKMVARGPASDPQYKIRNAVTWWMRWGRVVAESIQIASSIASTYEGGSQGSSSDSKSSAPAKPAPSSAPTRTTPTPAQDGHRGKS